MLVYINDKEDEEFSNNHEYAYVYEYDDDYGYDNEEDSNTEYNDYEIKYEINDDDYLVMKR